MKGSFYFFILAIQLCQLSCKKTVEVAAAPSGPSVITIPGSPDLHTFKITLVSASTTTAKFQWTDAGDYQSDSITYTISVNNTLVASGLKNTEYVVRDLSHATKYHLEIKALAPGSRFVVSTYDFTTHDGYTKFAKPFYSNVVPYDIVTTSDDNYIVAIYNPKYNNVILSKIDTLGNEIWKKTHSFEGQYVIKIKPTTGGYLVMGIDYIFKINLEGTMLWSTSLKGAVTLLSNFIETNNKDLIFTGYENFMSGTVLKQALVIKLDASGNLVWRKPYGQSTLNEGTDIVAAADGSGFYILGAKSPITNLNDRNADYWVFKIDVNGNTIWEKTFGNPLHDFPSQIKIIGQNLVVGGYTIVGNSGNQMQVFRLDFNGNILKNIPLKSPGYYEHLSALEPTSDGGYIVSGLVTGGAGYILGLFKYTESDKLEWSKEYSPGSSYWSKTHAIKQTADKGFIVPATTFELYGDYSNLWLLKLNPSGSFE